MSQLCKQCKILIKGRSDKCFCSPKCKNAFNNEQKKRTRLVTEEIDGYLHRNRIILNQVMGNAVKQMVDRLVLVREDFKFDYFTSIYINKENKMYRFVYDYGWMDFSDQKVLIIKKMVI
ncbi:MAG: hypothetical protein RIS64_729 [Bacteroidota bacterium]|jgi:hypothetical protein